jgi:hypothetical protein
MITKNRLFMAKARDGILIVGVSVSVLYAQIPLLYLVEGATERVTTALLIRSAAALAAATIVAFVSPYWHLILGGAAAFVALRWLIVAVATGSIGALVATLLWIGLAMYLSRRGPERFSWQTDEQPNAPSRPFAIMRASSSAVLLGTLAILASETALQRVGVLASFVPSWIWLCPLAALLLVAGIGLLSESPWRQRMLCGALVAFVTWLALVAAAS